MKIIFDSEEEKRELLEILSTERCPSDYGLKEQLMCEHNCMHCWIKAVEEIEVKDEGSIKISGSKE